MRRDEEEVRKREMSREKERWGEKKNEIDGQREREMGKVGVRERERWEE